VREKSALATKQLRLEVAQLTDVGRKREHNEDNMAYVIPKDQQVMAKKGALFIVADGMGGHAAGEVASEIAVDTVSNVYYQDDSDDVAISLLHAIKRANALIHQRAAENMLRSGMGTTCVSAVLRGNMAYIANVGDSRAYLVRNGQVKQVSQDHSWVAEQVRAGLLTEDQARTHAQRNVITRCLGTQPDVEVDVFPEELEEHDALVLCSDGLSGLVSDEEILRIVAQSAPQESVYHLVERANENGGPDNITAIVISVQEVGWEPPGPGVRSPVYAGTNGRETGEDTAILGVTPSVVTQPSTIYDNNRAMNTSPAFSVGTALAPDAILVSPAHVARRSRSRLLYPSLALVILIILGAIGGGVYFYTHTGSNTTADQHIKDAQHLIAKANSEVSSNPASALRDFATAQGTLRSVQQNSAFSTAQRTQALRLLQGDLTNGVQKAIISYNKQSFISPLCSSNATTNTINLGTTGTQPKVLAQVQGKSALLLYALGMDGQVYQVNNNSLFLLHLPVSSTTKVLDIAGNGSQLAFLLAQPVQANNPATNYTYSLSLLSPAQAQQTGQKPNQLKFDTSLPIDPKLIQNGQMPKIITASAPDLYVVFGTNSTQTSAVIVDYVSKVGKPLAPAAQYTFSFSDGIVSLAAFPNHQLFFLLADGSIQSLQFTASNQAASNVLIQGTIPQPLATNAKAFTWQTPVPTVTTASTTSLAVPGTTSTTALAVGLVKTVPHLFVLDMALHRVLDLTTVGNSVATPTAATTPAPASTKTGGGVVSAAAPVTLKLVEQYVSAPLFTQGKSMAVDTQGTTVNLLTQSSPSLLSLIAFSTNQPNTCS